MNKINFDFEQYGGKDVAVHCKTEKEAEQWCQYMHEHGLKWSDDESYSEYNEWGWYEEDTCYRFNKGQYSNICWCIKDGYTIIEFSSLINNKLVKL